MQIGQVLRYSKSFDPQKETIDNLSNFLFLTRSTGLPRALLEKGINPIAEITDPQDVKRRPAVLISSSPHKVGSTHTPWQDVFDPDNGHIRYYGDNKTTGADPASSAGNKVLLETLRLQSAYEKGLRILAPPLIFFQRTAHAGVVKGHVKFQGFGLINRAEVVTQFDQHSGLSFSNYAFDCSVFDMSAEAQKLDWTWVNSRRDSSVALSDTLKSAPKSWRTWVNLGNDAIPRCTRHVSKLLVTKKSDQLPAPNSKDYRLLVQIHNFYEGRKHRFEGLAYSAARKLLSSPGHRFIDGWITPRSSDGGGDFVCRVDLGKGFATVKQLVYGQAKCSIPTEPINGNDIARTVARLKRGWFGVFVTTSYFSEPVQREIIEDQYPLLLVNGKTLAEIVSEMVLEGGFGSVPDLLKHIDSFYDEQVIRRRPEEIFLF